MTKNRKFRRMMALAAVLIAGAPSGALARPDINTNTGAAASSVQTPAVVRVVATHDTGFDWGDAGVGAGGAIALVLLLAGGFMLVGHRRHEVGSTGGSALAG